MEVVPRGRHFAESRNCFGKGFNEIIDFSLGIILTEAEEYISLGERFRQADGGENRGEPHGFGDTGGTGGDGDALGIKHEGEALAFHEFDATNRPEGNSLWLDFSVPLVMHLPPGAGGQ